LPDSEKIEYEQEVKNTFNNAILEKINNGADVVGPSMGNTDQLSMEKMYMQIWRKLLPLAAEKQKYQLALFGKQLDFEANNIYPMMQDRDVKYLSDHSLFEIGAHTRSHVQLSAHKYELQELEIYESVKYLQELTGQRIHSMSYPFGSYNRDTLTITKRAGFDLACTTVPEAATRIDDSHLLPRITVNDISAEALRFIIDAYL